MKPDETMQQPTQGAMDNLYRSVRKVIEQARGFVSVAANTALVRQNWEIGRLIVEHEQGGNRKAEYGKAQIAENEAKLANGRQQLQDGWAQLNQGKKELAAKQKEFNKTYKKTTAKLDEGQKELDQKKEELDQIIADTKQDEERLRDKAKKLEAVIEPRLLTACKRIRKGARNGLAVVDVQRGACGGCFN